jgi:hypothetical protein
MNRLLLLLCISVLYSNTLTIYNNNLAYATEDKAFSLKKGEQILEYNNTPKSLYADSVVLSFEESTVKLLSQSFRYQPLTLNRLLDANIGSSVEFYKHKDSNSSQGVLLSINPTIVESNKHFFLVNPKEIIFSKFPENVDREAKLLWRVVSPKKQTSRAQIKYLMGNLSWQSNYTATLDNGKLNLKGWAKITNKSSKSFKDANITLVAGELNRESRMIPRRALKMAAAAPEALSDNSIEPKPISGYYLYKLPNAATLAANETKQISLIDAKEIKYRRYAKALNQSFYNYRKATIDFQQVIEFKNSKANNLGVPLPAGLVRVYGKEQYLGEKRIGNIAKNEKVKLAIGKFFDLKGTKKITKYVNRKNYRDIETQYSIHNSGKEALDAVIEERADDSGNRVTFKTSCSGRCSVEKKDAFSRVYTIQLKADEHYEFTTEYENFYQ